MLLLAVARGVPELGRDALLLVLARCFHRPCPIGHRLRGAHDTITTSATSYAKSIAATALHLLRAVCRLARRQVELREQARRHARHVPRRVRGEGSDGRVRGGRRHEMLDRIVQAGRVHDDGRRVVGLDRWLGYDLPAMVGQRAQRQLVQRGCRFSRAALGIVSARPDRRR